MAVDLERRQREYLDNKVVATLLWWIPFENSFDGYTHLTGVCRGHLEGGVHWEKGGVEDEEYAEAVANAITTDGMSPQEVSDLIVGIDLYEGDTPVLVMHPHAPEGGCDECYWKWLDGAIERGEYQ